MVVELINTGSELMLGRTLNTHQYWLCRQLADLGYVVTRQVAVPDTGPDIQQAVREALGRADLIITTGGLGPTSDDLTRELIAELLGRKLREDTAIVEEIRKFFSLRNRPMPENNRVQAMVPEGALVLANPLGTAPGLAMQVDRKWLVMLPGPPRELRPMFAETVVPLLQQELPLAEKFAARTFRTIGVGESTVQQRIGGKLERFVKSGLDVGYCAHMGQVDVRLAATGKAGEQWIAAAGAEVEAEFGPAIFAEGDDSLETVVIRLLADSRQTLAVAESCTGGGIADRLTNVPGASAVFLGGFVTYSNELKQRLLGVKAETLAGHGAVSEAVAREMAEGARSATGSDYAIAVTGIAGPAGGTAEKPVGTVFMALASKDGTAVWKQFNPWDRLAFKEVTAKQALNQLRLRLLA
ncbi:MAG: competence/damage-inducible protein A [Verrucomicrobiota bacterium]